jgi:hypothetical protein
MGTFKENSSEIATGVTGIETAVDGLEALLTSLHADVGTTLHADLATTLNATIASLATSMGTTMGAQIIAQLTALVAAQSAVAVKEGCITIPHFTGWTKDTSAKTPAIPLYSPIRKIRIKSCFVNLGTAPGGAYAFAVLINGSAAVTISAANTQGENKALDIAVAAGTDIVITVTESTSGAGANCDIMIGYEYDLS